MTDRGKSVCRSHSESKENAALLVSQFQMAVASTVFSISVLKPAPFSFAPFWIPQFLKTNHHRFFTSLMWILCFSWSSHMHLSKWCSFHRFFKNLILITEVITWHVNQPRKPDFCRWLDREVFILCFKTNVSSVSESALLAESGHLKLHNEINQTLQIVFGNKNFLNLSWIPLH